MPNSGRRPLEQPGHDSPSFRRAIGDTRLQCLYDYWLARRGALVAMPRDALDPTEIPSLLRNLVLADVADGGHSIRYRLVGTEVVAAHGLDYTGLTVEELTSGETLAFTRRLYGVVVGRATPVYSEGRFRWEQREYRLTRRLHLPMSRQGDEIDMVLLGQVFDVERAGTDERLLPARPEELAADLAALPGSGR